MASSASPLRLEPALHVSGHAFADAHAADHDIAVVAAVAAADRDIPGHQPALKKSPRTGNKDRGAVAFGAGWNAVGDLRSDLRFFLRLGEVRSSGLYDGLFPRDQVELVFGLERFGRRLLYRFVRFRGRFGFRNWLARFGECG